MKVKRGWAASIVYNGALHVFGGCDAESWDSLSSSEIIHPDGTVTESETTLEIPLSAHAISSVNKTFSIITGGRTSGDPDDPDNHFRNTWYYNHDTQKITAGKENEKK